MQRFLAIDCDARELCFVVASSAGDRVTLEIAATVSVTSPAEDRALTPEELGKQIQAALAKHKRSGTKYLTTVDRNAIELTEITVPPAADAELPELVVNQLSMDSPNIVEDSVIDFIASPGDASESRRITAAALSRTEFTRINAVCSAAGFSPDRLLMRPYETALLFLNQKPNGNSHSLLVNVIADEVDLIVVDQSRPLFFRTVRLPAGMGDEAAEQRLLDEIRRTLLIAPQNADVGQVIDAVYVFGTGSEYERLVQHISKDCSEKVELFDPFAGFTLASGCERQASGRVIPLLGMVLGEARGGKHAIDFLHPRRAPNPPNRRRQLALAAIVTAVVGGAGWYHVSETFATADREIKALREESVELDARIKKTVEKRKITEALDEWNANTVVWLDELRDLCAKFPPGHDIVVQRLALNPSRGGKASISFLGMARNSNVVPRMEAAIQDSRHEIQTPRVEKRDQDKNYSWGFESTISLVPAKLELDDVEEDDSKPSEMEGEKKTKSFSSKPRKSSKSREKPKKTSKEDESPVKDVTTNTSQPEDPESEKTSNADSTQEQSP